MKQSHPSSRQLSADERTVVADRIVSFLRRRHPVKMPEHVEAATGISAETVAQWEHRHSVPGGIAIARMIVAYGPEFLCAYLASPPAWLDEAYRAQRREELQQKRIALEEEMRALSAK